ncbi:unnamed protein product [Caenorhabditis auriculariae]|uniref:Tetratricopeptide repeat protein 36 homolog n=1 Tax=Caenorhabditis auriculariae TaxID=2777116 RepID=A0A8S1HMH7_9PELO|nr:unnamed protein product [Caenorhabditis auriculariae]
MATAHDRAVLNQILNPLLPNSDGLDEVKHEEVVIEHEGFARSVELEREGVRLAESGKSADAIAVFSKAIESCPVNPSAYNNRAQAYRLNEQIEEALADLNEALKLGNEKGKAACQAFVQRGSIYRLQGNDDKAREDFQAAAELGSSFAKMQLVTLNPYAAMCNKMLSDVFSNMKNGKTS